MEAQLGLSLDKSLQCSSWGSRPLSSKQLQYAALDAAVLLMLLDSIIAAALPCKAVAAPDAEGQNSTIDGETASVEHLMDSAGAHTQLCVPEHSGGVSSQCSGETRQTGAEQRTSDEHLQSTGSVGASSSNGTVSQHQHDQPNEEQKQCSASRAADTMRALASLSLDSSHSHNSRPDASREQQDASLEGRALPSAASAAQLQEAAQIWGIRLEVGGGCRQRPQKPSKDKRPGVREQFRQDSASSEQIGGSFC